MGGSWHGYQVFPSTDSIFAELDREGNADYSATSPAIVSIRRALQREFVSQMTTLSLDQSLNLGFIILEENRTDDVKALARYELQKVLGKIEKVTANADIKLDTCSAAHLTDLKTKIEKTLNADIVLSK